MVFTKIERKRFTFSIMTTYQPRSRGEVRTHTGFCPADFESTASANSATLEEGMG